MGRISIDTRQVRTLGQVLQATSQDLNRTNKRVRDRHNETQLNHQRDPNVAQIKPGVNLVDHQLTKTAREYDRLAQHATQTAKDFDNADKTGPQQRLDNRFWPRIDLPGYFPLLGTVTPLPSHPCQWPNIAPTKPRWFDWFSKGLRAGRTALNRISGGLRNFTGTVTNVGKRFINGTRGLLGKATNWASGVKDKIGDKVDGVKNKLSNGFNTIAGGLSSAFNWSKNKLTSLIKNTWNAIWDGLTTTLKTAIAGIKQLVQKVVRTSSSIIISPVGKWVYDFLSPRTSFLPWGAGRAAYLALFEGRQRIELDEFAIRKVEADPGFQAQQDRYLEQIREQVRNDSRYRNEPFEIPLDDALVGFGGQREGDSSRTIPQQFIDVVRTREFDEGTAKTRDVALDDLTWLLRNATVRARAGVDANGQVVIYYQIHDTLDLRPGDGRSDHYNTATRHLGMVWHDWLAAPKSEIFGEFSVPIEV